MTRTARVSSRKLIGMVHVRALPGTPRNALGMVDIVGKAVEEAKKLADAGYDAVLLENMHDLPYCKGTVGSEIVAAMTTVAAEVRSIVSIPVGLQVLAGANQEALSIAVACNLDFIRVEGFVFSHIGDEGFIDGCAAELLRLRRELGGEKIKVYTDIKKKHSSHAITNDLSIEQVAEAADFFLTDGVIITGDSTGKPADLTELERVRNAVQCEVWIGSGLTSQNLPQYLESADGFIVGSWIKKDGHWANELDPQRSAAFVAAIADS